MRLTSLIAPGCGGSQGDTEPPPVVLLIYPDVWLPRRSQEWGPLAAAAAAAGFDAVVAGWEALALRGDLVRTGPCLVHRRDRPAIAPVGALTARPRLVMTTWGVDGDRRPFFDALIAATGARHTESWLLSWLDGKAELELCLRAHEARGGARVPRPATTLSQELAEGAEPPDGDLVIVKPSRGGQCRGIEIVPRTAVPAFAREAAAGGRPHFVAQGLVDTMRLHKGRRWDARLHGLATSLVPLRQRTFHGGVAKTAGAAARPGSADLDEWLNAESHLQDVQPAENLCLEEMMRLVVEDRALLGEFWERVDALVTGVFAAIAHAAESWRGPPERPVLVPGLDVIVTRGEDGAPEPVLLELNSHPGLAWEPHIAACLARHHRDLFAELHRLS